MTKSLPKIGWIRTEPQAQFASSLKRLSALILLLGLTIGVRHSWSQATWGTISGFVTDPSDAAVPNANVTITNEQTGVETTGSTDSGGLYNFPHLNPGSYSVSIEARGFQKFKQENVVLRVDSTIRADAKLVTGAISQEITVTGAPPSIETAKTDVSTLIDQHSIENLPVANHNLTNLYLTIPGVVPHNFQIGNSENPSEGLMTSVNGQLWMANDYQVDGISDLAWGWSGLQIVVPPFNSVQELKVTTADFDPEYGSVGGMVAQYVTKSGANEVHGDAYWFNKNSYFSAANPFTEKVPGTGRNGTGTGPSAFNENVGGVSVGGPVRKNSLFFFGDYRLDRRLAGANIRSTVPSDAFRTGNFSAFAASNPIFDPATGNPDGTGRQQFSCNGVLNVICPNRFSPVAVNLLKLLPAPNLNQSTDQNYLGSGKSSLDTDQIDGRGDWNISDKDRFFVRYSYMWSTLVTPALFGIVAGGPAVNGPYPANATTGNQLGALNYTRTFSPTLVSEFRGGVTRFVLNSYQPDANLTTSSDVGIPGINDGSLLTGGLSGISVGGPLGGFSMGTFGSVPRLDRATMFQFVNNWTKEAGKHEIRWGVDLRRNREDLFTLNQSTRGQFNFSQNVTGTPSAPSSGLAMASFLLGEPSAYQRGVFVLFPGERVTRASLYGGDTWHATPKLTVNYGVRWDYFEPLVPRKKGGDVNFDFTTGDLVLAGLGDVTKYSNVRPRYNNFAPRLGIAYRLTEKTVIRAGLGRSYFQNGFDAVFNHLDSSYPIAQAQVINQSNQFEPIFPINQGAPTPVVPAFPSSGHLKPPPGDFIKAWSYDRKISSIDSWNFTLQRQVAKDLTISIAYVGNKGTHLDYDYFNYNAAPPGLGDLLSRRPFYQRFGIDGGIFYVCDCDDSNYNGLEIQGAKRFSSGYSINSSFTWARALDHQIGNRGYQPNNPYDRRASYGVSFLNRAAVWVTTHAFDMPYGKGRRFGSNANGFMQAVLGGWRFDGVTTLESGTAFSPNDSDSSTLNADFGQRPNVVLGAQLYPSKQGRSLWFNPGAFQTPQVCCVWGNAGPGTLRGPGLFTADWALGKAFKFRTPLNHEATTLEFRWENFNAFNKTNLALPQSDINNPTAGQIFDVQTPMRQMQFMLKLNF